MDCGFPSMAARGRLLRAATIPSTTTTTTTTATAAKGDGEGRVVESLSNIVVENKWCLFVPSGSLPPARAKHAALAVGRRMFVLGGASADGILDDVQVFHAERSVWLQLGCGSTPSLYSPSRCIPLDARGPRCIGHNMAFWEAKLLVLGGRIEPKSPKLKVFALDLQSQSWSVLAPKGEVPVGRSGQTTVQVGSALVLFGGEDCKGQMLNDIHILDLKALVWLPLKTTGSKPSPRRGHLAACYSERYMLIFGGKAHGYYYNDVHSLDLQTMEWTKEKPKGMIPTGRAGHAGVIAGNKWYIVGGEFRGNEVLDTLEFNLEYRSWTIVTTVQPGTPLANDGLSLVKIRNRGKTFLLVFGGHGAILSNQVFVMMVSSGNNIGNHKGTTSPSKCNRRRDEPNLDDFSTCSLPFLFTTGKLQNEEEIFDIAESEEKDSRNGDIADIESLASSEHTVSTFRTPEPDYSPANYRTPDCARPSKVSSEVYEIEKEEEKEERERVDEARRVSEELESRLSNALSSNFEIERALKNVLKKKEEVEKRLEEALKSVDALEKELSHCRSDGAKQLEKYKQLVEEAEEKIRMRDSRDDKDGGGGSGLESEKKDEIHLQLQESEKQIVFAVRKQALAERKLLAALKENRDLKKQLLLASHLTAT